MATEEAKKNVSGGETEGGITSSYATNDGVTLKVPYSFMGSIYDEAEEKAAIEAMHQDTLTMGPKTAAVPERVCEALRRQASACGHELHYRHARGYPAL